MKKLAIIGAGLAGLTVARALDKAFDVFVFDKSRGVSGRMSTRYADPFQFDHGAQYMVGSTPEFQIFLQEMATARVIKPWEGNFGTLGDTGEFQPDSTGKQRLVAVDKMNALAKHLATGLTVSLGRRISHFRKSKDGQFDLIDDQGHAIDGFDAVISAMPHPQLMDFLAKSGRSIPEGLDAVRMAGCYSLMIGDEALDLPAFDGAAVSDGPVGWIGVNSRKPDRATAPSLLIQSTPDWADAHLDYDQEWVRNQLVDATAALLGDSIRNASHVKLHRWRYAFTKVALGQPFLQLGDDDLYAVGDWCLGDRVENAFESGLAAARHLAPCDL